MLIVLVVLVLVPGQARAATGVGPGCPEQLTAADAAPKQINLVLDDSGSMFYEGNGTPLLDRWAFAKYALEVFASLMGPNDVMNVYRLSDFNDAGDPQTPILSLGGAEATTPTVRANQMHTLPLKGSQTPFLAVDAAYDDLKKAAASEKWLMVVTDGAFQLPSGDKVSAQVLNQRIRQFVERADTAGNPINVAYLAIGAGVPAVKSDSQLGIIGQQAATSQDLLKQMNILASRVFGRKEFTLPASGQWAPGSDKIDLDQAIVFAQGSGASVSPVASTTSGTVEATEIVDLRPPENEAVKLKKQFIEVMGNEGLQGQVAFFNDIPAGDVAFDVTSSVPVQVFYRPKVGLGYQLTDPTTGEIVDDPTPVEGLYSVKAGFMDQTCAFVESSLLGDPQVTNVRISQNGKVIAEGPEITEPVTFGEGEATIEISGTYLDDVPISTPTPFARTFMLEPLPGTITAGEVSYDVSKLGDYPPAGQAIPLTYALTEAGATRPPTAEEWAMLDENSFIVDGPMNLEYDVRKGEAPGQLGLYLRAPEGDVYKAFTGTTTATVTGSYVPGQTKSLASASVPITVNDDLSLWDRLVHNFLDWGWKLLLALLLLLLLLGYLFKRRFARNVKRRPSISGTPTMIGMTAIEDRGKFIVNPVRRWLPFVANTATLSYVPAGTPGFRPLKLKASSGRLMTVTNWKSLAEKDNVEINGNPLNAETKRAPKLGPGATITATTPQMTYELTPNT